MVALFFSLLALLVFPVLMFIVPMAVGKGDGLYGYVIPTVLGGGCGLTGFVLAIVGLSTRKEGDTAGKIMAIFALVAALLSPVIGLLVTAFGLLMLSGGGAHGRPLRRRGVPVLPRAGHMEGEPVWRIADGDAALDVAVDGLAQELRDELARGWLEDARTEHASVAAFSRLSLDLLAIGAPPGLILRTHAAAMDEVHHARIGYSLASRYAGVPLEPLEYAEVSAVSSDRRATVTLATVAVESLLEGVVGEGACACLLTNGARSVRDPVLARHIARLGGDETGHFELAKDIVRYCVDEGGPAILDQLHDALSVAIEAPLPVAFAQDVDLRAYGRFSGVEWRIALRDARVSARSFLVSCVATPSPGADVTLARHASVRRNASALNSVDG